MHFQHPGEPILNALEKRFGRLAFPSPLRTLVLFQVGVMIINYFIPEYERWLVLDKDLVLEGQVWRLISFIFIPRGSIWFVIFMLFFTWMVNDGLVQAWGDFRLNLYLFASWLVIVLGAWFIPGFPAYMGSALIFTAALFAFATLYPDHEILFMLIFPLKIKFVAFISAGFLLLFALGAGLWGLIGVALAMSPYLTVFGPPTIAGMRHRKETAQRRARFQGGQSSDAEPFHACVSCGKTDQDDPTAEFRVEADGEEYCLDCLESRESKPA